MSVKRTASNILNSNGREAVEMSHNRGLFLSVDKYVALVAVSAEMSFAPRARRSLAGPRAMLGIDHGGRGLAAAAACVQSTVLRRDSKNRKVVPRSPRSPS